MSGSFRDPAVLRSDDEDLVDVLEERRHGSDLGFTFRTFSPPSRPAPSVSSSDLRRSVLDSLFLRHVAKEVAVETGSPLETVMGDAGRILEEMSQNLQLGFIRLMAFTLTKVFKKLFRSIFINLDGLNTLQQAVQENPVVLMPNHRSYVDFLIVSYVLFAFDLPVPVIAAGIPLAGMKIVGEILRRSGAFFIRRSIGSDKLYWGVLSEYVRTIIRKEFAPFEFYVEGFRSRTLKSLTPKLGMMHMVLEPFFKGEVFDVTLVPISISYDRVLEESLLAHELLGVPKPRESTAGLLKASRILQEDFGSMFVIFGRPLSVRSLCEGRIDRCRFNLRPRHLPQQPSADVQSCVSWLAHLVVRLQEEGSVIGPWSLMCCQLLQNPVHVLTGDGLDWQQLSDGTVWTRRLAVDCGARLSCSGSVSDADVMASAAALHRSVIQRRGGRVYLLQEEEPQRRRPVGSEEGVMRTAVAVLMLASYRNQALHVFVRPAMLAVALNVTRSRRREQLLGFFCFLQDVFSHEFIFVPGRLTQDFEEACFYLKKCGAINIDDQEVTVPDSGLEVLSFLQKLLQPFIDSYQVVFRFLCEDGPQVFSEKQLLPALRQFATNLIISGELHTYEALSSDTQKNVLSALRRLQAVTKLRASEQNEYRVNREAVRRTADMLAGKIPPQMLQTTPDARL
uniref:Dihydroxyacetone phosphate acyltransferase-like n=1 Tax=Acanthochromis polyacanthus TaxID=80966 RepID=A0A3Q1GN75_9TELE